MSAQAPARPGPQALAAATSWSPMAVSARAPWRLLTGGLLALDATMLLATVSLAYLLRFKTGVPLLETPPYSLAFYSSIVFWAVPVWLGLFALYRLYDRRYLFHGLHEYTRIFNACTTGLVVVVLVSFLDTTLVISRGWLILTWVLSMALVTSGRFAARRLLRQLRYRGWFRDATLIVGGNEEGRALAEQFLADPGGGLHVVGFVDPSLQPGVEVVGDLQVLGDLAAISDLVQRQEIREVVIAPTAVSRDELLELYRTLGHDPRVELRLSSGLFEMLTTAVLVQESSGVPLITPQRVRITGIDAVLKSTLDYVAAAAALLVTLPVLLALALLIKIDSPGPAFHRRRVMGRRGTYFDAFKLRTMMVNAERRQQQASIPFADRRKALKIETDPRITRLGRFLRASSLDELPQLLNVLRGEMSLVGPRMIAPDEAPRYGKWLVNLHTVKPGITGPWQVEGRSDLPYDERVRLSMNYIRNYSIWLDLQIMLRTILVIVRRQGAY